MSSGAEVRVPVRPTLAQQRWFSGLRPESRRAHLEVARGGAR